MKILYYSMLLSSLTYVVSINAINDFVSRYGTYGHIVTMPQYFILHDYSDNTCEQQAEAMSFQHETASHRQCSKKTQKDHTIKRVCKRCHTT